MGGDTGDRRGGREGGPGGRTMGWSRERQADTRGGGRGEERADRGRRLTPRGPRLPEPRVPEEVTGKELDRSVHQQLRTLSKENAEGVAQHLVMVAAHLEAGDLDAALAHAETAVRRAGRVPAAREALGMVVYRRGDFARALSEFRTARRLSGSSHLLPLMVDCERGLGRPERALELAASEEAGSLAPEDRMELAIVVAGVRRDLGQVDAALLALQGLVRRVKPGAPGAHRLLYAYADTLLVLGREGEARDVFEQAAARDELGETDAVERLEELDGIVVDDLSPGDDLSSGDGPTSDSRSPGDVSSDDTSGLDQEQGRSGDNERQR